MRHRPRQSAGWSPMDQVRGGGGCGFFAQSGGGLDSVGRNCADPKRASDATGRSMLKSWKHLARHNSGGQALSLPQSGQSSVLDEPFIEEAQSFICVAADTILCSAASPFAKVTCAPVDFFTVAQADTIGARPIAIATSAESIVRSSGKRGNLRRAISAVTPVRSMQITVRC